MTTLYIVMMGLVAFAPSPTGDEMWVFLPNALGPQTSKNDGKIIHRHETSLLYSKGAMVRGFDEAESLDGLGRLGLTTESKGISIADWPLSYEELTISGLTGGLVYKDRDACDNDGVGPPKEEKPTAKTASAFCWVPRLLDVAPAHAELKSNLNPPNGLATGSSVRVLLRLKAGKFRTFHFSAGDYSGPLGRLPTTDPTAPIFEFSPRSGISILHKQAVADLVVVAIDVADNEVEFVAKKFGSGERRLALKGLGASANKEIWVGLFNVMDQLGANHPDMSDRRMRHFEMYYELSRNTPAPHMLTVPVLSGATHLRPTEAALAPTAPAWLGGALVTIMGGISRPICSMAQYETVSQ